MSADSVYTEPHEGYVDVRQLPEGIHELLTHVEQFLTAEGKAEMYREIGEALLRAIQTGHDAPVNRAVDAWVRTLYLKSRGMDAILVQDDPEDRAVAVDLDELRRRLG